MWSTRLARLVVAVLCGAACSGGSDGSAPSGDSDAALEGLLVTTDRQGMQLRDPTTGEVRSRFNDDGVVLQPTWSRDGSAVVAMAFDRSGGDGRLLFVDVASAEEREAPVVRPYFFFTWSPDGSTIAALGPGSIADNGAPATTLDVLDGDGTVVSSGTLQGSSLYLAWEPGGSALLAHRDEVLLRLDDPTDLAATVELDVPGVLFQAPAWVPGTRTAFYAVDGPEGPRLALIDVDTAESIDLGPTTGPVRFTVSPDGETVAVAHGPPLGGGSAPDDGSITVGLRRDDVTAPVEVIDLDTGVRTPVSDQPAFWLEWSPDGSSLALYRSDLSWAVWTDGELRVLDQRPVTDVFFLNYVQFADQYVETPRLWSPDGSAITYPAGGTEGGRLIVLPIAADGEATDLGSAQVTFWSPSP